MNTDQLAAVILAGGKSRRLGQDKVALPLSGESLLSRTVHLAQAVCEDVYVSGRDPHAHGLELPWFPDDHPGVGPMGGILTALHRLKRPVLALACDQPLLDCETVWRLVHERERRPDGAVMTTYRQQETGYIEALVAIYEPAALPHLERAARDGDYKLSRVLPPKIRHHIDYRQNDASVFFNINFPADLAVLRRLQP